MSAMNLQILIKCSSLVTLLVVLFSCAVAHPITFLCDDSEVEMFINDESIGSGMVSYTVPKGTKEVKVSCRKHGVEVYSRTYTIVGNKNVLYDIRIPKDYRYSNSHPEFK